MPAFEAFIGLRYDLTAVDLGAVMAPPYDVISPAQRAELAARHPANAVHVELPVPGPDGVDRYRHAAGLLDRWLREGLLVRERAPALYPYRMTPPVGCGAITGVIGALRLGPGGPTILPHEETLSAPRTDRLDLLRATRANLSPIWGLSLAPTFDVTSATRSAPALSVVDDDGVLHELWTVTDPVVHRTLDVAVAAAPVVIADGHHRYRTALAYQAECGPGAGDEPPWATGAAAIMAFVAPLSQAQTVVGPVHRAVTGIDGQIDLVAMLERWFDILPLGPVDGEALATLANHPSLALLRAGRVWALRARPRRDHPDHPDVRADDGEPHGSIGAAGATGGTGDAAATAIPGAGDPDAALLDAVLASLPPHQLSYCYSTDEATRAAADGSADAVFLLRAPTVAQIADYAMTSRLMPPKTTYFWPKPRSGMVYRML